MATLLAKIGLIDRATVVEGHITGFLDSVEVNANKITAGTLVADRILLKGSKKGLLYALNNLGELASTTVDSLDGYVLTDRTINADKIVANSITANELDVANIFANNAVISTITSQEAFINAISTNSVVVGAKKTADEIKENIYSPNTTTIDGGKITTNSIKAEQIDVANLFAQDITASGTITGAKLYGTYLESTSGKIADFNITENGFSRELDWVDQWSSSAATITGSYKAWCEITPNGSGQINIGAGVGTFSYHCPTIRCGYYDRSQDGKTVTKITSFETDMMGISTNYFKADKIISDLIPIQTNDAESTPSGYRETFPSLGSSQQTWQNLYVKSIYVKAGIGDVGDETTGNIEASGKITAQGDIIAGLGTSNQTSLFDKANKKWRLIGNATQDNKIHIPQSVYDIAYEYYIVVKTSHGATFPFYVSYSDVKKDLISGYYLSASYCATARLMATSRTDKDGFDISLNMAWTKELYNGQASTFEIYIYYR